LSFFYEEVGIGFLLVEEHLGEGVVGVVRDGFGRNEGDVGYLRGGV